MIRVRTIALTLLLSAATFAGTVNAQCCSLCGKKVCHLEVSKETEEVVKFDVKPKEICIPGIKLPWQCKRSCGGVRTVCVLEEVKQEKTVCTYDWSVKTICTSCCSKHGLKRSKRACDICKDERIPFDYYALAPAPEDEAADAGEESCITVRPASAQLPVAPSAGLATPAVDATDRATRSPMFKLQSVWSSILK